MVNRWRGLAAGACCCAVLTRVTVMAVSENPTTDLLVLVVCWHSSSIGLREVAKKAPVVGTVKARGVPFWMFFANGVGEKTPPPGLTSCIQQDALPVPAMVAWALATKSPTEAGAIVATTVGTPADSEVNVLP